MKKFSSLLVVLLLMLASFTAGVEYQRGDVDQDGQVGIADVTCLIDYLLNGTWPDEPVSPDEHEWVDLGLPSGTLWATCNVGANAPEEYGEYFAWGETTPKDVYNWSTYKWCEGTEYTITKYCIDNYYGTIDDKAELDPEDDAAYVNWGSSWRMPSSEQLTEIRRNCSWTWTSMNGVNGELATGPNGNTIFFPAAGIRCDESLNEEGSYGYYWTRKVGPGNSNAAIDLYFYSEYVGYWFNGYRDFGLNVRPVRVP